MKGQEQALLPEQQRQQPWTATVLQTRNWWLQVLVHAAGHALASAAACQCTASVCQAPAHSTHTAQRDHDLAKNSSQQSCTTATMQQASPCCCPHRPVRQLADG